MKARRIVVVGTLASDPYAGMAWMHMQIVVGLRRLGHDVYYFETTSAWPYDPIRGARVSDSAYSLAYLARVAESFGLGDKWAYRRSYGDKAWFGLDRHRAVPRPKILAIGHKLVMLVDQCPHVGIIIDVGDLVVHRVRTEEHQPPHLKVFFCQPGCAGDVEDHVRISE